MYWRLIGKLFICLKNRYIVWILRKLKVIEKDRQSCCASKDPAANAFPSVSELSVTLVELFDKANSQCKKFQIIGNVPHAVLQTFHTILSYFFFTA